VSVYKGIFIPTAFSPNNDGLNDVWRVPGLGIFNDHQVLVFNRYGQVVFSTKANQSWDGTYKGKPQPIGVYPYLITVKEKNMILKGWITIVR
jgi:gliding motility-associated-like protein